MTIILTHLKGFPENQLSFAQEEYMEIHKHLQISSTAADATGLMVCI